MEAAVASCVGEGDSDACAIFEGLNGLLCPAYSNTFILVLAVAFKVASKFFGSEDATSVCLYSTHYSQI